MPDCPHCHQPVASQAIACPYCQTPLKAYGHPGIPLHRTQGEEFLCTSCLYHEDDTCNYPQRPYAKECILYHNRSEPIASPIAPYLSGGWPAVLRNWCQRNLVWLVLIAIILIGLLLSF